MKLKTLLFVFSVFLTIAARAGYEVVVSTNYPPYNFIDENGKLAGFNIDILNAIQEMYDIDIKITGENWDTANKLLDEEKIQAIAGAHYPGITGNEYIYTRSVVRTSHCFLFNRKYRNKISSDIVRTEPSPLIVMWQNDVLIAYILSVNPNARFIFVNNYEDLLNELEKKEVTCAFSQKISSMYYAVKMNRPYIKAGNEELLERNMGFKVSVNEPQLASILNNGLEVIMSNGQYRKIYDKWIERYDIRGNNLSHLAKYLIFGGFLVLITILILLVFNYILKENVKSKTRDLQLQLELNTKITKELEKQKFRAEESDKMKSAFLANMSHEIRTPMNGIMGFTELLKSHDYSADEQKQFIEIIQLSGERMLTTINNIIEISKIESGVESVRISETKIEKIIEELVQFFHLEARKKGIELFVGKKEVNSDVIFYSDGNKLNSIITNLIKNALKFTLKGYVKIDYFITEEVFSFNISDTGIGIAKDRKKAIFNHFEQADFSISNRFEGSGLGLSICREYTKMLNGSINVDSELNKGSTFYVSIPNQKPDIQITPEPEKNVKKVKYEIPKGLKIIVAEDDSTSFFYLKYILEGISANILHATTGYEAIDFAKKHPDTNIILMDSKMPEMDGIEAVRQIRKFNPDVYIIAQTAFAQADYKAKTIKAGCNEFIEKPVDKQKLLKFILKGIQNN